MPRKAGWQSEFKKGAIEICLLSILNSRRMYGFQIVRELDRLTDGYLKLKEGTLYPALHRLEKRGLLKSEWVIEGGNKPRKYYVITESGRRMLSEMTDEWVLMTEKVKKVLEVSRGNG